MTNQASGFCPHRVAIVVGILFRCWIETTSKSKLDQKWIQAILKRQETKPMASSDRKLTEVSVAHFDGLKICYRMFYF